MDGAVAKVHSAELKMLFRGPESGRPCRQPDPDRVCMHLEFPSSSGGCGSFCERATMCGFAHQLRLMTIGVRVRRKQ